MGGIPMKYTLLPQGLTTPKKTLIPATAVFILLALSACGGSNALAAPSQRSVSS
jgi:hypothetical protein